VAFSVMAAVDGANTLRAERSARSIFLEGKEEIPD